MIAILVVCPCISQDTAELTLTRSRYKLLISHREGHRNSEKEIKGIFSNSMAVDSG